MKKKIWFQKYKPYVKKYWYCFILAPFFMVLESCGEFILPYLNANIIDIGAANGDIAYIVENGVFMVLLALAMLLFGILGANFAIRGSNRMTTGLRADVFKKVQKFSFSDIDKFTTGSIITRITNDITQIQNFTQTLLRGMFRSPVMLVGAVVMSFSLNSSVAWVILAVVPLLGLAIFGIIMITAPRYSVMQKQLDEMNTEIKETVTNERVIKSFVREDFEKKKFHKVNEKLVEKSIAALKMMILLQPISALAINVTTLAVIWLSGKQIMLGTMEIGTLTALITYLSQILTALNFVAMIVLQGTRANASDKRISEIMNNEVLLNDDNALYPDHEIQEGSITFENVSFRYYKNSQEKALDNISFSITGGELVGIIGSTGSGKSTLVSMIPRLYDVDEGRVLVDGIDVKDLSLFRLRESVAMVLQKNVLFSGTIAENLCWGKEDATEEEMQRVCKIAQADGFIRSFPNGYETELGQGGANLSGGQKQRLCIARSLLKDPKIIILDDSTSAVDTATDASIRYAFRTELPHITKIIIAQRINSVMDADKIIVMDDGKIVGMGKHKDLLASCKTYQEIYWSQKDKEEEDE